MRIHAAPPGTIMEIVKAVAANPGAQVETIAGFAGYGKSTAERALRTSASLGLIENSGAGYSCAAETVSRSMSRELAIAMFREALQGYRPFEALCEGLVLGEDVSEAARRARILLSLPESEEKKFAILARWGQETGILEQDDPTSSVKVRADLVGIPAESPTLPDIAGLDSTMKARLFVAQLLGQDANNYLDDVDRGLLAEALLKSASNPKLAVDASGQALEDFLRVTARDKGFSAEAKKCSGAGQLANLLYSKSVIHSHHQKLINAPTAVRNAKAHKKDKKTLVSWDITPEGAITATLMSLVAIRSVHEFVFNRRQQI